MMHIAETYLGMRGFLMLVGHQRLERYTRAIREQVQELNLAGVHVVGAVDEADLAAMFRSADAVVTASEHEGFCIPLLEAMTFEKPIVARACAAIPETVGDAALLVPADAGPGVVRGSRRRGAGQRRRCADAGRGRAPAARRARAPPARRRGRRSAARGRLMRLLYVVQRYGETIAGGAEQHCREMAERMAQRGHHVEVATTCAQSYVDWADAYEPGRSTSNGVRGAPVPGGARRATTSGSTSSTARMVRGRGAAPAVRCSTSGCASRVRGRPS